jgi:hypothetical protein
VVNSPAYLMLRQTLPDFVSKWRSASLTERAGAQMHFIELCDVLGQPHPAAEDYSDATFTFEKGVTTTTGDHGFAEVWMRGHFAWEYKGKDKNLNAAYQQLLKYREDLENPPLLVVCDLARFEVHTNFTGTVKRVYRFSIDGLLKNEATADCGLPPIEVLRALFTDPNRLRPDRSTAEVTERAAAEFATRPSWGERRCDQTLATTTWTSYSPSTTVGCHAKRILLRTGSRRRGHMSSRRRLVAPACLRPREYAAGPIVGFWSASRRQETFSGRNRTANRFWMGPPFTFP